MWSELCQSIKALGDWTVGTQLQRGGFRSTFRALLALALLSVGSVSYALASEGNGVALLQPTAQVEGVRRIALVIGNGAYAHVPALKNTVSDADAISTKLRGLGYQIQYAQNVDRREMNDAITAFLARVEPGMEATVYYSGHGVELNGANFLLPVDIPALDPAQERMLRTEGVNVNDLLLDISDRHANVTLVILDACRDNPFHVAGTYGTYRSLGSTRGLATVSPPRGSFVIFSAGAGEEALDNLGAADPSPNGLFTRKLLALMDKDGLELRELVRELRVEVSDAASATPDHHSQVPGYYDQMLGDFYFRPRFANSVTVAPETPAALPPLLPPTPFGEGKASSAAYPTPSQLIAPPPQRYAYAYSPPSEKTAPSADLCRPGEERRDGLCQTMACAIGMRRNVFGMCVATVKHANKKQTNKGPSPVYVRPRVVAVMQHRAKKSGAGCLHVDSLTYC